MVFALGCFVVEGGLEGVVWSVVVLGRVWVEEGVGHRKSFGSRFVARNVSV